MPKFGFARLLYFILLTGAFLAFGIDHAEAEEGLASWYGPGVEGRTTASGEPYDPNDYTAAHKTLPFGTDLMVSYGPRSLPVTVNDRGPFVGTRELDLSQAAARDLGLIPAGVDYVEYDIIGSLGPDPSQGIAQQPVPSQGTAQQPGFPQGAAQQPGASQRVAQQPDLSQGAAQQPELTQDDGNYLAGYPDYSGSYPAAQDEASGGSYIVQPGDTLSQIATQLGVPVDYLAGYNGITDPNLIYGGQPLYFLQILEKDPAGGVGGDRTTDDAAIYNPVQMENNATTAGLDVAGDDSLTAEGDIAPGSSSEDGEPWAPTGAGILDGAGISEDVPLLPTNSVWEGGR